MRTAARALRRTASASTTASRPSSSDEVDRAGVAEAGGRGRGGRPRRVERGPQARRLDASDRLAGIVTPRNPCPGSAPARPRCTPAAPVRPSTSWIWPEPRSPLPMASAMRCTTSPSPACSGAPFACRRIRAEPRSTAAPSPAPPRRSGPRRLRPRAPALRLVERERLGEERPQDGRLGIDVVAQVLAPQRLELLDVDAVDERARRWRSPGCSSGAPPSPRPPPRAVRGSHRPTPRLRTADGPPQARSSGLTAREERRAPLASGSAGSAPPAASSSTHSNDRATPSGTGRPSAARRARIIARRP